MSDLFIDISEEFVSINFENQHHVTSIETMLLWQDPKGIATLFNDFLKEKDYKPENAYLTVPVTNINYQIITLPEAIDEKDKEILLGLEIDKNQITQRFSYQKLSVTEREEEGGNICDYIVISLKPGLYEQLETFFKASKLKIAKIVPSFLLVTPPYESELTATAWVGSDRTEIAIWGKDCPLALTSAENNGDQMGDINRYVSHYFDQIGGLELSLIKLYGPRMRDESITYSLAHPNIIMDEPRLTIAKKLTETIRYPDISQKVKLAKPPIELNVRNITLLVASALGIIFLFTAAYFSLDTMNQNSELIVLRTEVDKNKKLLIKSKQLDRKIKELKKEKEFYLNITKRRTPWKNILVDLAKLTPKDLWLERFSAAKASLQFSGKAVKPESVSDFEINLNNSSKYFDDAQVIGIRDFVQEERKYTEYQMMVKLKSPNQ